ncbi:MAG TPA: prolyl oligopeptidase family serine peptidase [Streptosporangiaceae bacterium]|jgi:dipeptidyl aminopeptidase/acylaminoacyl peptidase|nr:prolyl oligopeptidase family serine peptidase [Streptosporangiaceae bacterium]
MARANGDQAAASQVVSFGEWPSPITAAEVARGTVRLSFPEVRGGQVWWQEVRPNEGGRTAVVHRTADGRRRVLPAPWNARTRVHEYGGMSYLPVPPEPGHAGAGSGPESGPGTDEAWGIVFANFADQRLYLSRQVDTADPVPLTPPSAPSADDAEPPAVRYADFVLSHGQDEIWCVREQYRGGKVCRAIVAVPLDGSASDDPAAVRELVTGADFFAFPVPSPDGSRLAWICWNHPRMPWDGTELRVALVENGRPGPSRLVMGGARESVMAPVWRDESSLYAISDWAGWWNLYQVGIYGEPARALLVAEEEFIHPLWQLGARPFAVLGDGRIVVLHGRGDLRLGVLDPETGEVFDPDAPFTSFAPMLAADGTTIAAVAGGPDTPESVVRLDAVSTRVEALRRELDVLPDVAYLPVPRQVELAGTDGRVVHALVYPPSNPDVVAGPGGPAPYVVWVHGGPTSAATTRLDLSKAFFTSRGIGIVDVNYGGSSGFGRAYRERLRGQWGVVDVEDAMAAARFLAEAGEADPGKLAIRGGSAGGWTSLAAVTTGAANGGVFAAAASYCGVADLVTFAAQTHDFESRYLDGLIGPLPRFEPVYLERSPLGHVTEATCPILLLQGADDPIVPFAQSQSLAEELAAHGIRHAFLMFEGESHGFRKAESVIAALEAELAFYGQIFGFDPPGVPRIELS